jgi:DNA-binding GntR family transcriptional regulator
MSETRFLLKRDYIVAELRAAIASGELRPGQKLRQEELAARFQISSTPVREALRILEAEGLVTSVPHVGVFVTSLTEQEVEEYYRLRALLESYAASEAVTRLREDPARREAIVQELLELQARLTAAVEKEEGELALNLNRELHLKFYDEVRSPLLKQMIADLWKRAPFSNIWLGAWRPREIDHEHHELIGALRQDDPDAAGRVMRKHIELSLQTFLHRRRD